MKSLYIFFSFLLILQQTTCLIKWPFQSGNKNGYPQIFLQVEIGTPPQKLEIALEVDIYCPGLAVGGNNTHKEFFNLNASSTFHWVSDVHNFDGKVSGYSGTENFVIVAEDGTKQNLTQKQFEVIFDDLYDTCDDMPRLALKDTDDVEVNSFMDSVLADQDQKVAVLVYNNAPARGQTFNGTLYLGGQPDECSTQWHTVPEYVGFFGTNWEFQLDKVEVGKYSASEPGIASFFLLASTHFEFSFETYYPIRDALKVVDDDGQLKVPCNSTTDIIFTINGYDLHIQPQEYMAKPSKSSDKYCLFYGSDSNQEHTFFLPSTVFDRYCLMLDYGEKRKIGLAEKVK